MGISLFFVQSAFAIRINEVELNPEGSDGGNEWIEFYHDGEFDLTGYYIENKDGDIYYLNATFSDYYSLTISTQWLDNTDEKIFIKDSNNQTVFETDALDDSENDIRAWSFCDDDWLFVNSTGGEENECDIEENQNNETKEDKNEREEEDEQDEDDSEEKESENIPEPEQVQQLTIESILEEERETISLGSAIPVSNDKNVFISRQEKLRRGIVYGFITFTLILAILLAFKKL